jgi:transposase
MPRLLPSDEHWSKLREIQLHKAIYNKRNLRMTFEGMLYRMRGGCPWRDFPEAFVMLEQRLQTFQRLDRVRLARSQPLWLQPDRSHA